MSYTVDELRRLVWRAACLVAVLQLGVTVLLALYAAVH